MEPNEHFEKRTKEFGKWIDDICRECQHQRLFHLFNAYDENLRLTEKYVHSNCNFVLAIGGFCGCKEWMSNDNLEYIELLAKRKGFIPEDNEKGEEK